MYIIRKIKTTKKGTTYSFKTFDGWATPKDGVLDLTDVQRHTKYESVNITLPDGHEFVWYGCYPELTNEKTRKRTRNRGRSRPRLRSV